jgi:hypothetical protein
VHLQRNFCRLRSYGTGSTPILFDFECFVWWRAYRRPLSLNLHFVCPWLIEADIGPFAQWRYQLTVHQVATVLVEIRGVYEMTKFTVFRRLEFPREISGIWYVQLNRH